jgi:hypothetical protein
MTAPTPTRPKSTVLVRVSGLLFALSGLAAGGLILVVQLPTDPTSPFNNLLPALALSGFAAIVLAVAFLLLFLWLPRTWGSALFLVLALGSLLTFVTTNLPEPFSSGISVVLAAVAILAAVFVVVRKEFAPVTGILFLIAIVVREISSTVLRFLGSGFLEAPFLVPVWVSASVLVVIGLALLIRPQRRPVVA